jgi:hypothetical protein
MKNNFFVHIISLTPVDIMAARKGSGDNEEGLRNLVESVPSGSNNESSEESDGLIVKI